MKNFKTLLLGAILVTSFVACSDDDDNGGSDNPTADSRTELYASNNNNGNITVFDLESNETSTYLTASLMSEGIYYDASTDVVTQASRSGLQLNSYAGISLTDSGLSLTVTASGSADLVSPRDIAVNGNIYVVADNSDVDNDPITADGRLFVYVQAGDGSFTLRNTVTTEFKVWGIEFVGNDLYAVVDTTSDVALFANFVANNTTDTTVSATKQVTFDGIVRTHGLAFDAGTMILTDVGAASDDADGGFHIVTDFVAKFSAAADGGNVAITDQIRVAGAATNLGNPVAAEFDAESNTVFIAEAANGGGRVMSFAGANLSTGGDFAPSTNATLAGASSLYFYKN